MYRNLQIEDKVYIQQYDKLKRIERDIMPTDNVLEYLNYRNV